MVATDRNLDLARMLMRAPDASEWLDAVDALLTPPAWHLEANCRGADQRLFFPEQGEPLAPARAICSACAVTRECLDEALRDKDTPGVWAGTSKGERRKMRASGVSSNGCLTNDAGRDAT
jgi:WhiB family redox-sensing transcriptional regulator